MPEVNPCCREFGIDLLRRFIAADRAIAKIEETAASSEKDAYLKGFHEGMQIFGETHADSLVVIMQELAGGGQ